MVDLAPSAVPSSEVPGTTHELLEADLTRLAEEVQRARRHPETRNLSEQELLKKSLQVFVPQPPFPSHPATPGAATTSPLPDYAQSAPAEIKLEIEYLLDLAFHEGLAKANREAVKSGNPFVLDAFHDALVGKLYPELKRRGILK